MKKPQYTGLEMQMRAQLDASSYNEAERTIEVTFATETPVLTYIPAVGDYAYEVLSHDPSHVRMERFNKGVAPVLDNHNRYGGTSAVLGRVIASSIENREGRATLKLSRRKEVEGTIQDIQDGILNQISAGYRVYAYELVKSAGPDSQYATYRAIDWEPREVSFAPVNADINSRTRSAEGGADFTNQVQIINNSNISNMVTEQVNTPATQAEGQRTAEPVTTTAAPAAAVVAGNADNSQSAITAERTRSAQIMEACRMAGRSTEFAEQHINAGTPVDEVRALIIREWAQQDPAQGQRSAAPAVATVGADNALDAVRSGITGAIMSRIVPGITLEGSELDNSRSYRGYDLLRMAEDLLTARGENVRGLTKNELSIRAMSTSDFPILLGNIMNRQLRAPYEYEAEFWQKLSRQESASDFKAKGSVQVDKHNGMSKIAEGGEYKFSTLLESEQTYKIETFGEGVAFTRQMLINDDLSVLSRLPQMFAKDWNDKQGDIMWAFLLNNVKFADNKALFHADHNNLGAGSDLTEDALAAARLAFRLQKDMKGAKIKVAPKYLIVGPELETKAEKLLSQIQATVTSNVNVFANKFELIVENRIEGKQWFLGANPAATPMLVHAYLDGNAGLYSETATDFNTDAIKMKVRGEFGGQIEDYRGFYKNPGA